jgi:hypothetical protein
LNMTRFLLVVVLNQTGKVARTLDAFPPMNKI